MPNISWDAVDWNMLVMFPLLLFAVIAIPIMILLDEKSGKDKKKKDLLGFSLVTLLITVLFASLFLIPAMGPWKEMASGMYDHVEYTDTRRRHRGHSHTTHKTIVHFTDGRTAVLPHEYDVPFERGVKIRVMTKNNFYKIEKAEDR
jgi:hypothetical protein